MTDELTNLNWLCSITTPKSCSGQPALSPMKRVSNRGCAGGEDSATEAKKMKVLMPSGPMHMRSFAQRRPHLGCFTEDGKRIPGYFSRPPCSYSCLIAMALKASSTGCLPVHEIYRFVEQEYPFYKSAPEGWKNSIRHNLSMNQNFVKVQRPDGFQTKKGYYWAANPNRQHILDLEIERALKTMGRDLVENYKIRPRPPICSAQIPQEKSPAISLQGEVTPFYQLPDIATAGNDKVTQSSLEQLNTIAGIKTSMLRHFPMIVKRLGDKDDDGESVVELFGTSYGLSLIDTDSQAIKSNKQLTPTCIKRQSEDLCETALPQAPPAKVLVLASSSEVDEEDLPSYIKPHYFSFDCASAADVGYSKETVTVKRNINAKESDNEDNDEDEIEEYNDDDDDEELNEILKTCEESGNACEEEEEETLELNECQTDEDDKIEEIYIDLCKDSAIENLPDISTKEKALDYLQEVDVKDQSPALLPQLQLDGDEWSLPPEALKKNFSLLTKEDTEKLVNISPK